jgi:hypothetical protein
VKRVLGGSLVVVLLVAGAARAMPSWTGSRSVSGSGGIAVDAELAVDASGRVVAVWDNETGPDCAATPASLTCVHTVETAYKLGEGAGWDSPHQISRPGVGARPQAAIDNAGDVALLWVHDIGRDRVVQATLRRSTEAAFPDPNDLSKEVLEVKSHHIALDDAGDAVAVWAQRPAATFEVRAEVRPARLGYWGVADLLSRGEVGGGPSLAVTGSGEALAVWIENGVVEAAAANVADGTWSQPLRLSSASGEAGGDPVVAVNRRGDAVVLWQWRDRPRDPSVVQAAFRPAGGSWGSPAAIETVGLPFGSNPQVGIDDAGNAVAVWLGGAAGTPLRAASRDYKTGAWTRPVDVSATISEPQLAVDPGGNAVAVWINAAGKTAAASVRPIGGIWQPTVPLSSLAASDPRVAMDGGGGAVAIWREGSGQQIGVEGADLVGDWKPALANKQRPSIVGRARPGAALSCRRGMWEGTLPIHYDYAWLRNRRVVHGARGVRYVVRRADRGATLACRVTATNPARSLSVTSPSVRVRATG